ncbi:adenine phosphoribosyltransferase [Desulfovibrio porci]|uniref:adenine phosphoribosyltransferase n=1 Tax=Desulfovibrio porci TaxID=2605782 RepID=UPI002DD8A69D|nr:adenine phosphoribosyltransferase [Desulfovibrio porci]
MTPCGPPKLPHYGHRIAYPHRARYPQAGHPFLRITPLLKSGAAFRHVTDLMYEAALPWQPTVVATVDARGFLFAAPLAQRLGVGLVPVRKPGKLPYKTISASYDLEYGSATLNMHTDALTPRDRALIVDDVLATGGTAAATMSLVRRLGASVAGCAVLLELDAMGGRKALEGVPFFTVLHV